MGCQLFLYHISCYYMSLVAPLAGAWIEISKIKIFWGKDGSLPLRERGLKWQQIKQLTEQVKSRSPCGSVD